MIDSFNKQDFENALPCLKGTRQPLWNYSGLIGGEHVYTVPVKPGVLIQIRSSVGADGWSKESAKDSIRCWLTDPAGRYLGSKYGKYTTRKPGWAERMKEVLRVLWRFGRKITDCPKCGSQMKVFKTVDGPNEGRWYMKCVNCQWWDSWLTKKEEEKVTV